jgi:hypothetical protein
MLKTTREKYAIGRGKFNTIKENPFISGDGWGFILQSVTGNAFFFTTKKLSS